MANEVWNMPDGKAHYNNPDSPVWRAYQKFLTHKADAPIQSMIVNGPHPDYAAFLAGFLAAWCKCREVVQNTVGPTCRDDIDKIWTEGG